MAERVELPVETVEEETPDIIDTIGQEETDAEEQQVHPTDSEVDSASESDQTAESPPGDVTDVADVSEPIELPSEPPVESSNGAVDEPEVEPGGESAWALGDIPDMEINAGSTQRIELSRYAASNLSWTYSGGEGLEVELIEDVAFIRAREQAQGRTVLLFTATNAQGQSAVDAVRIVIVGRDDPEGGDGVDAVDAPGGGLDVGTGEHSSPELHFHSDINRRSRPIALCINHFQFNCKRRVLRL